MALITETGSGYQTNMSSEIKFSADCMLGKLCRWLRICGFDTFYSRRIKDPDLMDKAKKENRILLTRDHALFTLCQKKNIKVFLILDNFFEDQLKQVFRELNIHPPFILSKRCLDCNAILHHVIKSEIQDKVPPYIYNTQEKFYQCPICHKIFWPGTHWLQMEKKLAQILEDEKPYK